MAPEKSGFSFEQARNGAFWICHDDAKIALVMQDEHEVSLDLIEFKAPASGRDYEQPAALHNPTLRGARLSTMWYALRMPGWRTGFKPEQAAPDFAAFKTWTMDKAGNILGEETITVRLDAKTRRFFVDVEARLEYPGAAEEPVEFCNFLPVGAADPRPSGARFLGTLVQQPDGSFLRMPRNHISAACLRRDDIKQDGLIALVGEDWDPVVRLVPDGSRYRMEQCHALHDIHVKAYPADEPSVGQTFYRGRLRMTIEDRAVWDKRLKEAGRVGYSDAEVAGALATPRIVAGETCDFERGVDVRSDDTAHIWYPYCSGPGAAMVWDRTVGHSGSSSLRLENAQAGSRAAARVEPRLWARSGEPVRLSLWVKTRLEKGGRARIRIAAQSWVNYDLNDLRSAEKILDQSGDWQEVVLGPIMAPAGSDFTDVDLSLDGPGKVWFDDVLFVPAPEYLGRR